MIYPFMRYILLLFFVMGTMSVSGSPSWMVPYRGGEAHGADVIAFWGFDPEAPEGNHYPLQLRGEASQWVREERFGGALQVRPAGQGDDQRHGAATPSAPELTPKGPFTLELWICPDANITKVSLAYLIDKKYLLKGSQAQGVHHDYRLALRKAGGQGERFVLEAELGLGDRSEVVTSESHAFPPGVWQHVAFSYDGAGGCRFYINGGLMGERQLAHEAGPLSPGQRPLVIGDRIGSTGHPFHGLIAQVRLSARARTFTPENPLVLETSLSRTAFYRMEKGAQLQVEVKNVAQSPVEGGRGKVTLADDSSADLLLPILKPGEATRVQFPFDTTVREGRYPVTIESFDAEGKSTSKPVTLEVVIVRRPLPLRMPVIMWGGTSNLEALKEIGFTHYFGIWQGVSSPPVKFLSPENILTTRRRMDRALSMELGVLAQISPGRNREFAKRYPRMDRSGKVNPTLNGLFPEVQQAARELGRFVAHHFGDLPVFQGALIDTELRDRTRPSYHALDREAYRKAGGGEIPAEVDDLPRGVLYRKLSNFPPLRIIADDHPLLGYYRWFWKEGDGWNHLHSLVHEGLKSTGRTDLWTWFDPAVRAPSLFGSGGEVDFLSQWSYSYPDPLRASLAADELAAMAAGRPGQQVMAMTQLIWYRSQTAPVHKAESANPVSQAAWEEAEPEARFITIAPDHLSEALWLKLSHSIKGIMFHGWGSLVEEEKGSYRFTHPESRERLKTLLAQVVEPLGPTLMQVPEAAGDVAFLQSFASQMFAGRGTYGWGNGWGADSYLVARYAGLQPRVVYDETILKEGLDGYAVLFVTHCDVLTQKVAHAIRAFQQRGGILVGDEGLAPGLDPDILLESFRRSGRNEPDKVELLERARLLRTQLDPHYQPKVGSSDPEVILRQRRAGRGDYLFVANDRREYGDYVGQYRLVMERGLPAKALVTLRRPGGFVYDLVRRQPVAIHRDGAGLQFSVDLAPGDGGLFLILEEPLGEVKLLAPSRAQAGEALAVEMQLTSQQGNPIDAVVPVRVVLRDPKGREVEGSGHYGAAGGQLQLTCDLARNDLPGRWQMEVVEGLSGRSTVAEIEVAAAPFVKIRKNGLEPPL